MELVAYSLGFLCLLWTGLEVTRLLVRGSATAGPTGGSALFGAVDLDGGRPLDVVLDRRTRGRRDEDSLAQTSSPSLAV